MTDIIKDDSRNTSLTDMATTLLQDFYMKPGETNPQDAFARAATAFSLGDNALAQRLYDAASKQWFSFSSPVLSNAPSGSWCQVEGEGDEPYMAFESTDVDSRSQPISCFLSYVDDSIKGQIEAASELAALSVIGGGVGQHFQMRGVTDKSPGAIPYLKTSDSNILYYKQGKTRKGSIAAYLDINHPDIEEFINVRVPTGGDINRKCLNVHNAVNITDVFLQAVRDGDSFPLICPDTGAETNSVEARELWQTILETRFRTGEPYLNYVDEANRDLDPFLQQQGFKIHGSNLCNEIHLPTDIFHTAICCLSSLNLEYYDDWKDSGLVEDLVEMLDNVITHFIGTSRGIPELDKARRSAAGFRDIGIGMMGFHSYLQRNDIAFESEPAYALSYQMTKHIQEKANAKTKSLATERGEPPYLLSTGKRNAHLLAVAPNANSSIIAGCSPCIEPWNANAYTHRTRLGSHLVKNKYLDRLLKLRMLAVGLEDADVDKEWAKILQNDGSVKDCVWLTDKEKEVYKTVWEIDMHSVVTHARIRQIRIDQGQSINLFFPKGVSREHVNSVHLKAFEQKGVGSPLKGLYYLNTTRGRTIEQMGKAVVRDALRDYNTQEQEEENDCVSCHA